MKPNPLADAAPGLRAMAQRIVNAEDDFVSVLMDRGAISKTDAEKVFASYRKLRVVKTNPVLGRCSVTHGAFLDRDVILRALANISAP